MRKIFLILTLGFFAVAILLGQNAGHDMQHGHPCSGCVDSADVAGDMSLPMCSHGALCVVAAMPDGFTGLGHSVRRPMQYPWPVASFSDPVTVTFDLPPPRA
ncbi:hypothetical protein [Roseobacter sp. GAI101]|uniref:hypothetical protein n=1 Tax=Roseobacter sp. (strain GAI101) TaxID=391589 RepID=UPI0002F08801|nr:hypothetical protein [Roseobacter sp. GAI101]